MTSRYSDEAERIMSLAKTLSVQMKYWGGIERRPNVASDTTKAGQVLGDAAKLIRQLVNLCASADEVVSLQELVIAEQEKLLTGKCDACAYQGTCEKKGKARLTRCVLDPDVWRYEKCGKSLIDCLRMGSVSEHFGGI